jgi:hypothetical protein
VATTAGALPLAIALIAGSVLPSGSGGTPSESAVKHGTAPVKCESDIEDFNACHSDYPTGCTKAGKYDADLNLLKNKLIRPTSDSAPPLSQKDYEQLENGLPSDLNKNNRKQFATQLKKLGEGDIHELIGYLYYAKLSGSESSNCQLTGEENVDYHIGIGFDDQLAAALRSSNRLTAGQRKDLTQTSVIVEMTPHYRGFFEPNWTIDEVKANVGKKVKVLGQLVVDTEHMDPSQDCAFSSNPPASCWRASVWELHPVTGFFVCGQSDQDCDDKSANWKELGREEQTVASANSNTKPRRRPQ